MAREEKIEPDKIVITGGNRYYDYVELEEHEPTKRAIQRLHFNTFQHLQQEFGIWPCIEFAIHCKISKEYDETYNKIRFRSDIQTIPIMHEEVRLLTPIQYTPFCVQKKLNFKERIKVLFKGEL